MLNEICDCRESIGGTVSKKYIQHNEHKKETSYH